MQSFSIWQWIIIAILIVLVAGAIWLFGRAISNRSPKERRAIAPGEGPSGFQGWLVLLAIGVIVTPILSIIELVDTGDLQISPNSKYYSVIMGKVGFYIALIILEFCALVLMALRKHQFVPVYIATAISLILFFPLQQLYFAWAISLGGPSFGIALSVVLGDINNGEIIHWVSSSIGQFLWMLYVIRSRRVANTFVR